MTYETLKKNNILLHCNLANSHIHGNKLHVIFYFSFSFTDRQVWSNPVSFIMQVDFLNFHGQFFSTQHAKYQFLQEDCLKSSRFKIRIQSQTGINLAIYTLFTDMSIHASGFLIYRKTENFYCTNICKYESPCFLPPAWPLLGNSIIMVTSCSK